jgi:hypothetical protein
MLSVTLAAGADLLPPSFAPAGGSTHVPSLVTIANPNPSGAIFYTVDGTDPRTHFGNVAPGARRYAAPLSVNRSVIFRARVKSGTDWSDLVAAAFTADQDLSKLLFTEVMYHPTDALGLEREEFVEFKNVGEKPLDLSGLQFRDIADPFGDPFSVPPFYTFPAGSIVQPGQFVLLVFDAIAFGSIYPNVAVQGEFTFRGSGLNERAGLLALASENRATATTMRYWTHEPWPVLPDNHGYFKNEVPAVGFSLVRTTLDPASDAEDFRTWRASTHRLGSPGADDPPPLVAPIYVNELLTRASGGLVDTVELFNPNANDVELGGWWLSDARNQPYGYKIAPGTTIPAHGFLLLDESHFNAGPNGFSFSSDGERCFLFSGDPSGALTGYSHGFLFRGSDRNVSFGRNRSSTGADYWLPEIDRTFGTTNSGPALPGLMITEVMYDSSAPGGQFIELRNTSAASLTLSDPQNPGAQWGIGHEPPYGDAGSSEFIHYPPANLVVPPGGYLLLVTADPVVFRSANQVPAHVSILQVSPFFAMSSVHGTLRVHRPSGTGDDGRQRAVAIEELEYRNQWPWDPGAAGGGQSLERMNFARIGCEPTSWRASPLGSSPGRDNSGNLAPQVWAGGNRTAFVGRAAAIAGSIADDHWPGSALSLSWTQVSGPAAAQLQGNTLPTVTATFPQAGPYVLRLTASDGVSTNANDTTVNVIDRPFDSWRSSNFTPAELLAPLVSGPNGDPDDDGLTNMAEYFFATVPKQSDATPLRARVINGHLEVTWRQRDFSPDVEMGLERADRLGAAWFAGPGLFELVNVEIAGDGIKTITFRSLLPLTATAQQFVRLRLSFMGE